MRIVLCYPVQPQHLQKIQAAAGDAEVVDAGQQGVAEALLDADIYCGHAKVPVPWDDVVSRGRLRWIQSSAAGMDHCLVPSVVASDILVSSASGVLAKQVADHTLALTLGILRDLPTFFRAQERRDFTRRPTRDLFGATVGLIGLGGNGRLLADVLSAFEARILATDWFPEEKPASVAELLPPEGIDSLLPRVDVLILAAPLTDQTRGLMNARRLALMPEGSFLVNVARGPLVVEEDLAQALGGHLRGAAVDVTEVEPLPETSPLWGLENMLITPHVGGQRASRIDDMTDLFCENLRRFRRGERLVNQVDNRLGFPEPADSLWRLEGRGGAK
ncbi:Putative 2-hydroxyacid dehydrogenase [Pirellulimonas nuda]|uniref:2-hydroxyacid dehydrogenase n=1 Tax=Pirellulimonas nuda TaxID=2528009 RepID=A0A518DBE4_9BACT|nr:D-2-hydroxyacid dehydrogenase [Pirellulimonas nuda]QDU88778.1 Putative 2-hydroxyacid dehydrogenase [Pirellulimonas nuda]